MTSKKADRRLLQLALVPERSFHPGKQLRDDARRQILHQDLNAIRVLYGHYIKDVSEPSHGWLNKIRSFCRQEGLGPPFLLGFIATHASKNPRGYLSAILRKKCGAPQREDHRDSWEAWISGPRANNRPAKAPTAIGDIIKEMGLA